MSNKSVPINSGKKSGLDGDLSELTQPGADTYGMPRGKYKYSDDLGGKMDLARALGALEYSPGMASFGQMLNRLGVRGNII